MKSEIKFQFRVIAFSMRNTNILDRNDKNQSVIVENWMEYSQSYPVYKPKFYYKLLDLHHTGPINREMRNLITSLKNHNEQLKGEVARYKRKLKEAQGEISKVCHVKLY